MQYCASLMSVYAFFIFIPNREKQKAHRCFIFFAERFHGIAKALVITASKCNSMVPK